ncbi:MAG: hypothetical protein QNJ17_17355 [Desulfocapsaceae bacterium]|nr:hypothetical protein [Desulfocapsaceae bacterium]
MNYNDMRKPLLQSALVLLAVLIIIGFVAGSGAEGFFGGIASIIKGILYSVLFGIALGLSLVISVALLIAVFLGAIAIYSPDKAKDMFAGLQARVGALTTTWTESRSKTSPTDTSPATEVSGQTVGAHQSFATEASLKKVRDELVSMKKNIDSLKEKSSSFDQALVEMEKSVSMLPDATVSERVDQIEVQQKEIETKLDKCLQELGSLSASTKSGMEQTQKHEKDLSSAQTDIQSLSTGVEELRNDLVNLKKSSSPEQPKAAAKEEHRIFSYLEKDSDKKQFAKFVAEAVQQNMTYAEIDEFLSKSLPKKVDEIIKDHPTLTKEYIRDCKNS